MGAASGPRSRGWAAQGAQFAPGESYEYSNTNAVLAGLIASKVTGQDISTLLTERIFAPLGLAHTVMPPITSARPAGAASPRVHVRDERERDDLDRPARRPAGCRPCRDARAERVHEPEPSSAAAAGAAIATAQDVRVYAEALVDGRLLDGATQRQRLESATPINPADPASPGYGLALASLGPLLGHTGAIPGFQAFMGHDPQRHLIVVVLTNVQYSPSGELPANTIGKRLAVALYPSGTATDPAAG
jgi:D-alanyl-D-alanine carboxypeptidase